MTQFDTDTLQRARDGDRQAHAELYRAFAPMVYALAWRMLGSRTLAEDVLQDSFVEVIRKADQCHGDGAVGGWIKRIAINKCLSQLRSPWIRRRLSSAEHEAGFMSGDESLEAGTDARAALARALVSLSPTARVVVWLHDVEGYTHDEIGRLMGRSTSYSKSQLARAYRQLRSILEPESKDDETRSCLGILKTV